MYKGNRMVKLLTDFKKILVYSLIAAAGLSAVSTVYSLIRPGDVVQNIYLSFYYFGAFALILSVPQFYKRNEDAKLRRIRTKSFPRVNENTYEEEAALESFREFKGDGFRTGMLIVMFTLALFFYGFIMENIYYMMRG